MSFEPTDEDCQELLTPAELAVRVGAGSAFIKYAIDAGCPTKDGKLSHGMFVLWMTDHYNDFRKLVGLPLLPSHEAEPSDQATRVQIGNMLVTLTDYMNSRASDPEVKQAAANAGRFIRDRL